MKLRFLAVLMPHWAKRPLTTETSFQKQELNYPYNHFTPVEDSAPDKAFS
jgi:hypothetical protein